MPQALLDDREREHLLSRLAARYAGVYSPERVREAVAEVYARFDGAKVHTYVPLLAERAVRELLETSGGTGPDLVTGG
ncbi:hypothetical protein RB614_37405 [Phytohabitans sp. ZYX-F-186]|uniref:Protein-tyrosine-phosphatase-like N-terminal domain-containing protein n=1 Tax=Phytohabitans maris TaxID=3071409 RepID=A0ABU0ZT15_9ACTN|nr:hypothetical protein [Phytohabitans sp. ZYX-F-186]MDQ7910188.1 hypothetical protein [Phytohabitans sp. ZYX-F-186]